MATAPLPPSSPAPQGPGTPVRAPPPAAQWLFGRYRLEPAKQRLHADEHARDLDARACAVLLCLLQHAGDVVPRATLIAEAWPGADTVFDSAVSKVMRRLRTALGDHSGHVLQTVYGEGYRLALPAVLLPPVSAANGGPGPAPPAMAVAVESVPGPGAERGAAPSPLPPSGPSPATSVETPAGTRRGSWRAWLPWLIAALASLAAAVLAWLLVMRPPGPA